MLLLLWLLWPGCGPAQDPVDSGLPGDTGLVQGGPFARRAVSFLPGEGAGHGQDLLPEVVLGPPQGEGEHAGSLYVLSLGCGGELVLAFDGMEIVDGEGPDLIVFENAFVGWVETAHVAASPDGERWHEWPCDPEDHEGGFPGCAGVSPVYSAPGNGVDPADPEAAGGDAFDLADLGLSRAAFVRIRDSGHNPCTSNTGGADVDAVALVNWEPVE